MSAETVIANDCYIRITANDGWHDRKYVVLCILDAIAAGRNLPNNACSRRVPRRGAKVVKSKSKVMVGRTRR